MQRLVIHPCVKWYVYIKPHTVMKFTSFGLLPLHMLHITNLVKIGPVDMLTDDGRNPIVIGHLSDSGDLKRE